MARVTVRRAVSDIALHGAADERSLRDIAERIRDELSALPSITQVDLVLANILAGTLTESVAVIVSMLRPGGRIVLSGILADQADALMRTYDEFFESLVATREEGWVRIVGALRSNADRGLS